MYILVLIVTYIVLNYLLYQLQVSVNSSNTYGDSLYETYIPYKLSDKEMRELSDGIPIDNEVFNSVP